MIGWRWESVDTRRGTLAAYLTLGDATTLGPSMGSFPDGGWSAPARCWIEPMRRPEERRHPGEDAPSAKCTCGYRVFVDLKTAVDYMFTAGQLSHQTNLHGLVLVGVETKGKTVGNDGSRNLDGYNCVSAQQIRPAWPAFVVDERAGVMLRDHYGRDDIHVVPTFGEALNRYELPAAAPGVQ
jgi:hypothetical protein